MSWLNEPCKILISHNLTINFKMPCALMKNWVHRDMKSCHIITIKRYMCRNRNSKILKQIKNPLQFSDCKSLKPCIPPLLKRLILLFGFCTSMRLNIHQGKCNNQLKTFLYQDKIPTLHHKMFEAEMYLDLSKRFQERDNPLDI